MAHPPAAVQDTGHGGPWSVVGLCTASQKADALVPSTTNSMVQAT